MAVKETAWPNRFLLFPNPVSDRIHLQNIPDDAETVILFTPAGSQVAAIPINGKIEINIGVSEFSNGIYFLTISGTPFIFQRKVIIER